MVFRYYPVAKYTKRVKAKLNLNKAELISYTSIAKINL